MKYCKLCLQPNTRPNDSFSEEGVCAACDNYKGYENVDFDSRFEVLTEILENHPRKKGQYFDCIIGVSGGKDSTRQALWVRDKLKLNPLLVCLSYPPQQVSQIGVDNISNLIELGFDVIVSAPAPETWRKLMKQAFMQFANWARSTEMALYTSVPKIALRYKIPLIFIGENQSFRDQKTMELAGWQYNNMVAQNTLNGGDISWMLEAGFNDSELIPYHYPSVAEINSGNLQIVDLGWFIGDWDNLTNGEFSCAYGIDIRQDTVENTGDPMGVSALDEDWVTLNQMIKYYKFGFGKVTDYANEDIRLGRLKREDAISVVENYDGACSENYIESFCEYIDITIEQFWKQVKDNVNKDLFDINNDGSITPRFKVGVGL